MADNPCISAADQQALFGSEDLSQQQMLERITYGLDEVKWRKRNVKLQALTWSRHEAAFDEILNDPSIKDRGTIARHYIESVISPSQRYAGKYGKYNRAIETEAEAIKREIYAPLAEELERFRTPMRDRIMLRSANPEDNRNLIRAIVDGDTSDPDAMSFALKWKEASEALRREFNARGGNIAKRHNWGLPQSHNAGAVERAGFEQWFADIRPLLDLDAMDVTDEELPDLARRVWERIATDGAIDIEPGKIPKGAVGAIAKRHQERRFFQFKDGDSWLEYAKQYGNQDSIMEAITNHVEHVAHEISLMQALGPNPEQMMKKLMDVVRKERGDLRRVENLWAEISGKTAASGENGRRFYELNQAYRNWNVAVKLGSAQLSAITDVVFGPLTHWYNGTLMGRSAFEFARHLIPSRKADRIRATQIGNSADYAIQQMSSMSRYTEINTLGFTGKVADLTMRLSGLHPWTLARKKLFQLDTQRALAQMPGNWDELNPRTQSMLQRYGLDADQWPDIHGAQIDFGTGKTRGNDMMINPLAIENLDTRRRVMSMLIEEGRYATPEPGTRTRATLRQGTKKGTYLGEFMGHTAAFKSFPVTVIQTHWQRAFSQPTTMSRIQYIAALVAATTALGMVAVQAKRIASGKEPLPAEEPEDMRKLFGAGFMQGGGAGIFGDFVFADYNRFGRSLATTMLGPTWSDAEKYLAGYLLSAVSDATALENEKALDRLRRIPGAAIKDFTPGQLWYTKLLFQRAFFDEINKLADPNYEERMQKYEKKMRKSEGSGYYAPPGGGIAPIFEGLAP